MASCRTEKGKPRSQSDPQGEATSVSRESQGPAPGPPPALVAGWGGGGEQGSPPPAAPTEHLAWLLWDPPASAGTHGSSSLPHALLALPLQELLQERTKRHRILL